MDRLGTTSSQKSDWFKSTGYYSRLSVSSSAMIWRSEEHYPPAPRTTDASRPNLFAGRRLLRTEMLDLGHCDHYYELGEFLSLI